jgi:microcystin-dependent protein
MMRTKYFFQFVGVIAMIAGFTLLIQGYTLSPTNGVSFDMPGDDIKDDSPIADECMIGEIKMFAGNFAPRGWSFCEGELLPVRANMALFSVLGTTYGGDGRTNFALPDLRGRVSVHPGKGPGLSMSYRLGQKSGQEIIRGEAKATSPGNSTIYALNMADADNRQPSLTINYIICIEGIFPSRN